MLEMLKDDHTRFTVQGHIRLSQFLPRRPKKYEKSVRYLLPYKYKHAIHLGKVSSVRIFRIRII